MNLHRFLASQTQLLQFRRLLDFTQDGFDFGLFPENTKSMSGCLLKSLLVYSWLLL